MAPKGTVARSGGGRGACRAAPAQASFTPEGGPISVGNAPYGVVTADFNGDGRTDVATVNGTSSNLSVLLRQPGGGFAQETNSPFRLGWGRATASPPTSTATGDPTSRQGTSILRAARASSCAKRRAGSRRSHS